MIRPTVVASVMKQRGEFAFATHMQPKTQIVPCVVADCCLDVMDSVRFLVVMQRHAELYLQESYGSRVVVDGIAAEGVLV